MKAKELTREEYQDRFDKRISELPEKLRLVVLGNDVAKQNIMDWDDVFYKTAIENTRLQYKSLFN